LTIIILLKYLIIYLLNVEWITIYYCHNIYFYVIMGHFFWKKVLNVEHSTTIVKIRTFYLSTLKCKELIFWFFTRICLMFILYLKLFLKSLLLHYIYNKNTSPSCSEVSKSGRALSTRSLYCAQQFICIVRKAPTTIDISIQNYLI